MCDRCESLPVWRWQHVEEAGGTAEFGRGAGGCSEFSGGGEQLLLFAVEEVKLC